MSDRPITFSAPMVRALLDGTKTQTRRVLKPPYGMLEYSRDGTWRPICTKFFKGDRLWVKENFCFDAQMDHVPPSKMSIYEPRGFPANNWIIEPAAMMVRAGRVRPSIHMPRWASRLTLIVTDVRVQRLQEISASDTIAEGVQCETCEAMAASACNRQGCFASRHAFCAIWAAINGHDAWDANPWVAAVSFTVHHCNIDKIEARNDH